MKKRKLCAKKQKNRLTCRRCGNEWAAQPNKWTNMSFISRGGKKVKVIYCPACLCQNYLSKTEVNKILKAAQ
jgi:late competence protein required for DNA uptake (superfamily II DNA/RNA helicase)